MNRFALTILFALSAANAFGADLYADFVTASHEQRVKWMLDGEFRTNMVRKVGTPPKTELRDVPPRWCGAEGVNNFRDLGGWTGLGGKKVRYGRIFRSTHLGHVKDPADFVARFGVKTDLDLRNEEETESLGGKSPLGEKVRFVLMPSPAYEKFGKGKGRKFFGRLFRVFLDEGNYPVVFHCAKGADRTGSVAFLLNGLLGVRESDLVLDWELTAFFNPNPKFRDADRIDRLVEVIRNETGDTWTEKVVSYAKSCGITDAEIAKFRSLMLEEPLPQAPVSAEGERPVLKVGIVSDTHVKTDPKTVEPLFKAFSRFAAEGVRVVVIAGDLCHEGELRELEALMGAWRLAFPDGRNAAGEKVEPFFVFGNHDYHAASYMKGRQVTDEERRLGIAYNKDAAWKLITGEERFPGEIMKREVGGIVFIGAHWSHEKDVPAWLEAHAAELPKDRPIVYVQHPHPKGTCFGDWASNDGGVNFSALMKWPNLFAISGHSHISVSYDDAIWQGGFCSMGAGSTLRTNPRKYEYNAVIPSREVREGLSRHMPKADCGTGWQSTVMTIYPSRIVLDRREHRHDDHLGENWVIPFPFVHDRTNPHRIAAAAAAPAFMPGAAVKVAQVDGFLYPKRTPARQVRISFPAAASDGPHSRAIDYRVEVFRKSDGAKVIERLVQQEGASLAEVRTLKREGWCAFGLDELPHDTALSVKVTPINAGGKGGRALEGEFDLGARAADSGTSR